MMKATDNIVMQPIPDKRYFTISEASNLCDVKPHVLRYWEQEFSVLKPNKRRGSRRYYQRKDIELIRQIRELLYNKGFTIQGARQQLKTVTATAVSQTSEPSQPKFIESNSSDYESISTKSALSRHWLPKILQELESILEELKN